MLGGTSCGPSASLPCAASIDGEMGIAACRCNQTGIGKVQLPNLQAGSLHTANCCVTMRAPQL